MEIYIDKEARCILRYIKRNPQKTLSDVQSKFGEAADSMRIIAFCQAGYLVCKQPDGSYTVFDNSSDRFITSQETFWISPKGKKLLEDHFDRLWQWSIPTAISVAALLVSILR